MLKKTITYKDLDGNPITEDFWFHLSRAEVTEMALAKEGRTGGFDAYIRRLIASQDGESITAAFKEIILSTLGRRSDDNKYFDKDDAYTRRFVQSDAYSVLLLELLTDADKMAEFVNGVVPKDLKDDVEKATAAAQAQQTSAQGPAARIEEKRVSDVPPPKDDRPDWVKDPNRIPTEAELRGASSDLIMEAFRRKSAGAPPPSQEQIPPQ